MKKIKNVFVGMACSTVFTIILILIYSLILTKSNFSEKYINTVIIVIYGIGMFIGTTVATRKIKKNGAIIGATIAIFYIIVLYLISSCMLHDFSVEGESIYMLITAIILGGIGGVIGVNIK